MQPLENFYKATGTRDGLRGDCKAYFKTRAAARYPNVREQAIARAKQWREDNPERYVEQRKRWRQSGAKKLTDRKSHLKRKYGMTLEDYDRLLEQQGGGCAICGPPREDIALHVDHDHETGRVRGLLCFPCNNTLGDLEDDAARLYAAAAYLTREPDRDAIIRARVQNLATAPSAN